MKDGFGREIDYLRVSITDRCDLRCRYCMPELGVTALPHADILRYEELLRLARIFAGLGFRHLRLTGGEPMVRSGCLDFLRELRAVPGIESVGMTSNGVLLAGRVAETKSAGLSALNLSIDSLDPDRYAALTRCGALSCVLQTLHEALALEIPVKVNCVPLRGWNEDELPALAELARENPLCVRFIELMPIGCGAELRGLSQNEVLQNLTAALGPMEPDATLRGWGPARYYRPAGFRGSIGLIAAVSHEFCDRCNRVRLTADGRLKLCLNRTDGVDLRALLRGGASDEEIKDAIELAVFRKPERHAFYEAIQGREGRWMNEIGG